MYASYLLAKDGGTAYSCLAFSSRRARRTL